MTSATTAIRELLGTYEAALNASSTDAVMPLYTSDGIFMGQYSPSAIGADAVRRAYDAVFQAITLNVKFDIAEIVEIAPDWAFARITRQGL